MSIKKNIPQVKALKNKVEELYGESLTTHWQFIDLVSQIEKKTKVHISETTLERVWNYSTRHYDNVSAHTLDVLSRYATGDSWKEFCKKLEGTDRESGFFTDRSISASDLNPGDQILIGWMPNRLCELTYLGNNLFEVLRSENTSVSKGDTFNCYIMQLGRPMYLDNYHRSNDTEVTLSGTRYAIGQNNGLTTLEITAYQKAIAEQ